ncbi:MAG: glycosyltransferase family 39 protein [Elusimicrobia bacterium]|nr:glycosyltransferase family 39 protein [Elusimicrobiota bacterium]
MRVRAKLTGIIALQLVLGSVYARRVALFNAPDEQAHFAYAEFIARNGRLPVAEGERLREAVQPPLYYLLAAAVDWSLRAWPLESRVLALRLQNVLLGALNVCLIFLLLRRVADDETALAGTAFSALLPQYLFISASATNDVLADLLSTLILYLGLLGLEERRPRWWPWAAGAALGFGFLAKLTVLGPALAFAAVLAARRKRGLAVPLGLGAWGFALTAARNLTLYGDLSGERAMNGFESPMLWSELGSWCVTLFKSFWGLFAWMASPLPGPVYWILAAVCAACAAGFVAWARREKSGVEPGVALLLAAATLVFLQTFYHGFLHTRQPQGRFLFPALASLSFGAAQGGRHWTRSLPSRWKMPAMTALLAGLAALQAFSLRAL